MPLTPKAKEEIIDELRKKHFPMPDHIADTIERWIADERMGKCHPMGRLSVVARLVNKYKADEYQEKEVSHVESKPE